MGNVEKVKCDYALFPCPWCGQQPTLSRWRDGKQFVIHCDNRNCEIWPSTEGHKTVEEAVAVWNNLWLMRHVAAAMPESRSGK